MIKKIFFRLVVFCIMNSFLLLDIVGARAGALTGYPDKECLSPSLKLNTGFLMEYFQNRRGQPQMQETARKTVNVYMREVLKLEKEKVIEKIDKNLVRFEMTSTQESNYIAAIKEVMKERGMDVIGTEVLFEAAKRALKGDTSGIKAKIGLQPGTMNPLHFGHISASLGGILDQRLNLVLLANGGTVPDKPYAASADIRNEMARIAVFEKGEKEKLGLEDWLAVTPIRAQSVEMFSGNDEILKLAGKDEKARRFNRDMAAFIWMFMANPNVEWVYIVGSYKVGSKKDDEPGYGEKGEWGLIRDTLAALESHTGNRIKILYFERTGSEVSYEKKIKPYEWLANLWYLFKNSQIKSFADLAAKQIREALSSSSNVPAGERMVNGQMLRESIPQGVIDYISADTKEGRQLRYLYPLENEEKRLDKLVKEGAFGQALAGYISLKEKMTDEQQKPDKLRRADIAVLAAAIGNLDKKINEIKVGQEADAMSVMGIEKRDKLIGIGSVIFASV